MPEQVVQELQDASGRLRVLIICREDGRYTYRKQELRDGAWGPPSIDAGIYDSRDTAETEARQRVPLLRELFH